LYTSTSKDGAIAEIAFHLSLMVPQPSRLVKLHEIEVATLKTLKISKEDFIALDIDEQRFSQRDYGRTQEIGAAAAHMGFDGLLVPSARTSAENLVLFPDNHHIDLKLSVIRSIETDWVLWRDRTGQK